MWFAGLKGQLCTKMVPERGHERYQEEDTKDA